MSRPTATNVTCTRSRRFARGRTALAAAALSALGMLAIAAPASAHTVWSPLDGTSIHPKVVKDLGRQLATWYGPGFWGNRTGCGSTLRRGTWGIAHKTLPCGKMVQLNYGGRSVIVPVIDRGPFSGASIDLTERTARYLRFKAAGHGGVRVRTLKRILPIRRL